MEGRIRPSWIAPATGNGCPTRRSPISETSTLGGGIAMSVVMMELNMTEKETPTKARTTCTPILGPAQTGIQAFV